MNQVTTVPNAELSMQLSQDKIDLIKNTICKGATKDELELFLHACRRTGLDPFMKQIYAVKRYDGRLGRDTMTIQTAIDGYRLIAERTGRYSPGRETTYQYTAEGKILSATAYVKKMTSDGTWHEVAATAFFSEYAQVDKKGDPTKFWKQMGHAMISKCAESLALRRAFPAELSGIYTKEEMTQAEVEQESAKEPVAELKPTISMEQAFELHETIGLCLPEDQDRIWSYLNGPPCKITAIEDLSVDMYDRIYKRVVALATKAKEEIHVVSAT